MTIEVKNQFILQLDLPNKKDFVAVQDFKELCYYEQAGMMLPAITLTFTVRDESILDYLNSGNLLTIGLGRTAEKMITMVFKLVLDNSAKRPSVGQEVTLSGVYYNNDFTINNTSKVLGNMSSLEVVNSVGKKYFNIVTNITKTNDRQNHEITNTVWGFLQDVCSNAYINDNTFITSAFDSNNLYFYDMQKLFKDIVNKKIYPKVFSKTSASSEDSGIINYNSAIIKNNYGLINKFIKQDTSFYEYDWETYSIKSFRNNLTSYTAMDTNSINMAGGTKVYSYRYSLNNGHANACKARSQNIRNMALYSSLVTYISFGGQFKSLHLLEPVIIDTTGDARHQGINIVSGITYQITSNRLLTNVTLVREGANAIKGATSSVTVSSSSSTSSTSSTVSSSSTKTVVDMSFSPKKSEAVNQNSLETTVGQKQKAEAVAKQPTVIAKTWDKKWDALTDKQLEDRWKSDYTDEMAMWPTEKWDAYCRSKGYTTDDGLTYTKYEEEWSYDWTGAEYQKSYSIIQNSRIQIFKNTGKWMSDEDFKRYYAETKTAKEEHDEELGLTD